MIDLRQAMSYLVDNHYLVIVEGSIIPTSKLYTALSLTKAVVTPNEVVITPVEMVKIIEKPKPEKKVIMKALWDKFVEDADVPYRVASPTGGKYTIRQYGPTAAARLHKIINSTDVDYSALVASTNHYYSVTSYKAILSNYILKDIWKEEYNDYLKNKGVIDTSGGNRFED